MYSTCRLVYENTLLLLLMGIINIAIPFGPHTVHVTSKGVEEDCQLSAWIIVLGLLLESGNLYLDIFVTLILL